MDIRYSEAAKKLKASEIREILKLTEKPEVISFAGGLPAPELFPLENIEKITEEVFKKEGKACLQYGTTEGYKPLREIILSQRLKPFNMMGNIENILIINGSQQALDFTGKLFINKGDIIIVESPSYLGAINAFKSYGPKFVEVPMDDDGMIIDELEKILNKYKDAKFIYTIPDFHNPTGKTLSLERRKALVELSSKYKIPVIEDSPYSELSFEGEKLPTVKSFDKDGYVIYLGSFSKTFCPGFRIGWIFADKELINKYVIIKQGADLQVSSLDQRVVAYYMEKYNLNDHIKKIIDVYKKRRNIMLEAIDEYMPKEIKFTKSKGGLFTWAELKPELDGAKLLEEALKYNVAFVPGGSFFPNGNHNNFIRLNYSNMPEDRIIEGIKRLSTLLNKYYK